MRSSKPRGPKAIAVLIVAAAALTLPASSQAVRVRPPAPPRVTTGAATHVLGTSALLTATINPKGQETSYYFLYGPGPTTAYGSQTPTASVGKGELKVKVGQAISGLKPGTEYHFRVQGVTTPPQSTPLGIKALEGRDHVFRTKGNALAFSLPRTALATYESPFILSGTLTGTGSAGHKIALQASPYPFLEPFSQIGLPGLTNASGRFSFRVANLASATQLRVVTLDPLPVYSPVVTIGVRVHVVLHVRSSGHSGLVRLYGSIAPAVNGARVFFQVQKQVRPGKSEVSIRYVSQFFTIARKGPGNTSRFSMVAAIKRGGRYRAYVVLPKGALASGPSQTSIVLRATPGAAKGKAKH